MLNAFSSRTLLESAVSEAHVRTRGLETQKSKLSENFEEVQKICFFLNEMNDWLARMYLTILRTLPRHAGTGTGGGVAPVVAAALGQPQRS